MKRLSNATKGSIQNEKTIEGFRYKLQNEKLRHGNATKRIIQHEKTIDGLRRRMQSENTI